MSIEAMPNPQINVPEQPDASPVQQNQEFADRVLNPPRIKTKDGRVLVTSPEEPVNPVNQERVEQIRKAMEKQIAVERYKGEVLNAYVNYQNILEKEDTSELTQDEKNIRFPFSQEVLDGFFPTLKGSENTIELVSLFSSYININIPYAKNFQSEDYLKMLSGNSDQVALDVYRLAYGGTLQDAHTSGAFICGNFADYYISVSASIFDIKESTNIVLKLNNRDNINIAHALVVVKLDGNHYYIDATDGQPAMLAEEQIIRDGRLDYSLVYLGTNAKQSWDTLVDIRSDLDRANLQKIDLQRAKIKELVKGNQ